MNDDDQYKEEIDGEGAVLLNDTNVLDEEGNDSDALSNEEIFNELAGLDFRPAASVEAPIPLNY